MSSAPRFDHRDRINRKSIGDRTPTLLYAIFFLSGASALIYEISWSRQIGLVFGQSEHTAAVVLGSYFAGMAIGYLLAARWVHRTSPLIGYAIAEILVACWAILIPSLLDNLERYAPAFLVDHPSPIIRTAGRALIAFLTILPATVALGATLPFMAQAVTCQSGDNADRVAVAYSWNTFGALAGVISSTSFLLLYVGVRSSGYLAASISAACGLVALVCGRGGAIASQSSPVIHSEDDPSDRRLIAISAISGFGILSLEVLYTRMFALVFHNSTYTFGVVVAFFLLALAIGSAVTSKLRLSPERAAGWACVAGGGAIAASLPLFTEITGLAYFGLGRGFAAYMAGAAIVTAAAILPPVVVLGMILPATWKIGRREGLNRGRTVGRLTAANTIAAAVGSLVTSFILVPMIGLWSSFGIIAGLFLFTGTFILWNSGRRVPAFLTAPLVLALIILAVIVPSQVPTERPGTEILYRRDGAYGQIDVIRERSTGKLTIRQNIHYGLGSSGDPAGRELAQGHLPLLLHPNPEDVLFLGVGTGVTAASALSHPRVQHATAVELNPDVVEASRKYFSSANRGVLTDPKVSVVVDDARHFLARSNQKYDVIISDLFVPWESRTGYLYTVEHYREARSKLKPNGLFCQWVALYQVGEREFESIADSLASVFPVVTLWWGQVDPDLSFVALIGSEDAIPFDDAAITARLARLKSSPEESDEPVLESASRLRDVFFNGQWKVRGKSNLNTDEHPFVEFLAPITQREDRLLKRSVLGGYESRVLRSLPRTGLKRIVQPVR